MKVGLLIGAAIAIGTLAFVVPYVGMALLLCGIYAAFRLD